MNKKYFLHRISHEGNVSYSLLKEGYITIGWEKFADSKILEAARKKDYADFNDIAEKYGECKNRSRWGIWYFANMKEGDTVIVPQYNGLFSAYEVIKEAVPIYELEGEIDKIQGSWDSSVDIVWNDRRLWDYKSRKIDLGFALKVKPIVEDVPRNYAPGKFISRMKIRTVNAEITDIKEYIEEGIKAGIEGHPVRLYDNTIDILADEMKTRIIDMLDDVKFELLIKWYLTKVGADNVWIPAKNENGKEGGADADIIAEFENLKHVVYVQAKHHEGITSEWAVEQIKKYQEQKCEGDSSYSYAAWVISSGDSFSEEAEISATEYGVRLIDGKEFSKMLIDVGLLNIDDAF